jgi:chromate reductase
MKILAISGSLRSNSSNTNILKSISKLVPPTIDITLFEGLADLPHFNPELEKDGEVEAVKMFRKSLKEADAVIFCTPEYAFGIPGTLKNALDWTVSSGELNEKPVAAISASPLSSGGDKALASLLNTLTALGTVMKEDRIISIPTVNKKLNDKGELTDQETEQKFKIVIESLINVCGGRK